MGTANQPRDYYQFRHGAARPPVTFAEVLRMIVAAFIQWEKEGWFAYRLGRNCIDEQTDNDEILSMRMLESIGFDAWPLVRLQDSYRNNHRVILNEPQLFTLIEFLYDHSAKPIRYSHHDWGNCGIHVETADDDLGRTEYSRRINAMLSRYDDGYELRDNGEVWKSAPNGMDDLQVKETSDPKVDEKVSHAIATFRRYGSSEEQKRDAIRNLAGVLEYYRDTEGTELPSQEEARLFEIANKFGIRHHNPKQKTQYNSGVWLDWMFYTFLNAVALKAGYAKRQERRP